jgi:hypothetical protein
VRTQQRLQRGGGGGTVLGVHEEAIADDLPVAVRLADAAIDSGSDETVSQRWQVVEVAGRVDRLEAFWEIALFGGRRIAAATRVRWQIVVAILEQRATLGAAHNLRTVVLMANETVTDAHDGSAQPLRPGSFRRNG